MIVDSHAHLDMAQFDADRTDVIRRARDAGVELVLTVGTGKPGDPSVEKTLALTEDFEFIYAAVGVHPHDAGLADDAYLSRMEKWSRHPKVLLWGEIGLDYYYDHSPRRVQIEVFRKQLQLARTRRLPVSIHCRDAWPELVSILKEEWSVPNPGGILHSFTGTAAQALEGAALGFLISFSGMVTFRNAETIRESARALALERILVETDCPYLAPAPHRGKRNEPSFVVDVAAGLSSTLNVDFERLSRQTTINFRRLTGLTRAASEDRSRDRTDDSC